MVKQKSILDMAVPVSSMVISKQTVATIYGPSGTGKTTLAASACSSPETHGLLVDMGEQGTASVIDNKYLDVIKIDNLQQINKLLIALRQENKYKTIIFDSMQTLIQMVVYNVRNIKDFAFVAEKSLKQNEWGQISYYMCNFITEVNNMSKSSNKNVIYICDEREAEASGGGPLFVPNLMGSVEKSLVGRSDCVVYTFIKKEQTGVGDNKIVKNIFCADIGPSPNRVSKIRKPKSIVVDSLIVDPTWDKLMDIIYNVALKKRVRVN